MKYTTLGIALFRKCNANCDVCCFESSPSCTEHLNVDLIKKFIDSAAGDKDLKSVSFTGGEPFLEYDLLLELVGYAASKGFNANLISNCFWAKSEEIAFEKIQELKKAGLKRMNVSFDQFHNEYIPAKNVGNVLRACRRLEIPVVLGMIKISSTDIGCLINQLDNSILDSALMVYPALPVGGAKKTLSENDYIKYPLGETSLNCQYNGNIVVGFDGKIRPCCNQCVVGTELIIGDYEKDDYRKVLQNAKNNGLLFLLRNFGLGKFIDYAKQVLKLELPDEVVSPCEICELLFCKENLDKFYPFVKEEIEKIQKRGSIRELNRQEV